MAPAWVRTAVLWVVVSIATISTAHAVRISQKTGNGLRPAAVPSLIEEHANTQQTQKQEAEADDRFPVLPNSPCADCHRLMTAVATSTLQLNLNRDDVILQTQTISQQMGVCASLGLQCHVYDEVKYWLVRGGVTGGVGPQFSKIKASPTQFCKAVNACGAVDIGALLASVAGPLQDPQDAVMVRMRLKDNLSKLPHAEPRWRIFVKQFLGDVATYLKVNRTRLFLKQRDGDYLAELVIQSAETQAGNATFNITGAPPELLGRKLKAALTPSSKVMGVPPRLLDAVDVQFQPQVVPLVVPSVVSKHKLKPVPPKPVVDCEALKDQSRTACGNGFKCNTQCQTAFRAYHGKCLSMTLDSETHQRVYKQFNSFFFLCRHCTPSRVAMVKSKCGLQSTKDNLPLRCSMACSTVYLPYFHECLQHEAGSFNPSTQKAVREFYGACRRCTDARQKAVRNICDARKGHQDYYYPGGCTQKCAVAFNPFYDSCLHGPENITGAPRGSTQFRHMCQTSAEGGAHARLTLLRDITSIVHQKLWRQRVLKQIAESLGLPVSRFQFTGVFPAGGVKSVDKNGAHRTESRTLFDFRILIGGVADEAPDTIVSRLRLYVSDPMNAIFSRSELSSLSSTDGVIRLIPNGHTPGDQRGPTSLMLAKAELRKAQEQQYGPDIIKLLAAIVDFHSAAEGGASASQVAAALANVGLQAAVAHNKPQPHIDYYAADYAYAKGVADHAAQPLLASLKAHRDYMAAVARDQSELSVNKAKAVWEWRQAVAMGANKTTVELLHAVVKLAEDRVAQLHQDVINMDTARVQYLKSVNMGASEQQQAFDASVLQHMTRKARHADRDSLDASAALVAYHKAILDKSPAALVEEKKAVLNYMLAKEQKKDESELKRLHEIVIGLRRALEKAGVATTLPPAHQQQAPVIKN